MARAKDAAVRQQTALFKIKIDQSPSISRAMILRSGSARAHQLSVSGREPALEVQGDLSVGLRGILNAFRSKVLRPGRKVRRLGRKVRRPGSKRPFLKIKRGQPPFIAGTMILRSGRRTVRGAKRLLFLFCVRGHSAVLVLNRGDGTVESFLATTPFWEL